MLPSDDKKIDEDEIVSVLKSSDKFNRFHEKEWKTRRIPTSWYLDQNLAEKAKAHDYIERGVRTLYIEFNHCPTIENMDIDSYIFAHEMGHIIRFYENKVLKIITNDKFHPYKFAYLVGNLLSNTLEDMAVDRFLYEKYEFNLLSHYESILGTSKSNLRNIKAEPQGLDRIWLLLQLIEENLRWSIIQNRESSILWMSYEACLNSRYHPLIKKRDEIISRIQGNNLDTPEQQRLTFDTIVNECDLGNIVCTEFDMSEQIKALPKLIRENLSQL